MKLIAIFIIASSMVFCSKEKKKTSNDVYYSFSNSPKAAYFHVPPSIVSILLDNSQKGNTELKDLLMDVNELSFLIIQNSNNDKIECQYLSELSSSLDSIDFCDFAQINSGKEIIKVKVDRKRNHYNELVVLVSNSNALYCISFKGRIPNNKVVNLVKTENVVAVTNLDRFNR